MVVSQWRSYQDDQRFLLRIVALRCVFARIEQGDPLDERFIRLGGGPELGVEGADEGDAPSGQPLAQVGEVAAFQMQDAVGQHQMQLVVAQIADAHEEPVLSLIHI